MDSREPREDHELASIIAGVLPDVHLSISDGNYSFAARQIASEIALRRPSPVAESTPSPDTEGVGLADELTSAIRIGVEDDVTIPFDLSVRIHAFLRTAQNTGRDEVLGDYSPAEIEFIQCLLDRYSEGGGVIPLADDHEAFMRIVRRHYSLKSSPPVSTVDEEGGGS